MNGVPSMSDIANRVSDAEAEVLKVLWASHTPMTERQITDALRDESDWSPTTMKTLLKRLYDKGAVRREKRDVFYYTPALSQADFAKGRTVDLLNKVFGGNAKSLVSTMLSQDILSEGDIDELKKYWHERGKKE